jgi:hypothetical protein
MKHWFWFILPFILAACGGASARPMVLATVAKTQEATQVSGFSATKLFALTAEMETVTAGNPQNDATITAIMGSKFTLGTAMAATMTAQPSDTPFPPVPADAPFCKSTDLQASFGSNGATQSILLSAGLKNTGSTACFLQSWPQVWLMDGQGKPLNVDYSYFDIGLSVPGSTATEEAKEGSTAKVGLWPGWSVWANLIWQNWCAAPVSGGVVIRLSFKSTGIISIPTDIAGAGTCNAQGQRSYVGSAKLVLVPAP